MPLSFKCCGGKKEKNRTVWGGERYEDIGKWLYFTENW
jgi:hypothetical protein